MFNSIAFGGGGVRGGIHVGAIAAIETLRGNLMFSNGIYGSSVGSIIGTAVAFNLSANQIRTMFDTYFHLNEIIPSVKLTAIHSFMKQKGLFPMDGLDTVLLRAFDSQGIDLRNKKIADAPQSLFIVATNMTTCKPVLFSGDVPILTAIRCSCCIPFVFEPQILYNNVYLDGGVSMSYFNSIVPGDCLILRISQRNSPLYPSQLESLSILNYMGHIYLAMRKQSTNGNTIWFDDDNSIGFLQELTEEMKTKLFETGFSQTTAFLTKRSAQELK